MTEETMKTSKPDAADDLSTIVVTPRQVRAAQIAVKGYRRLGEPVPPGLQRLADLGRAR